MPRLVLFVAVVAFTAGNAAAQEARSVLQAASTAMRADNLKTIHGRVGTHEEFLRLVDPAGRTN